MFNGLAVTFLGGADERLRMVTGKRYNENSLYGIENKRVFETEPERRNLVTAFCQKHTSPHAHGRERAHERVYMHIRGYMVTLLYICIEIYIYNKGLWEILGVTFPVTFAVTFLANAAGGYASSRSAPPFREERRQNPPELPTHLPTRPLSGHPKPCARQSQRNDGGIVTIHMTEWHRASAGRGAGLVGAPNTPRAALRGARQSRLAASGVGL